MNAAVVQWPHLLHYNNQRGGGYMRLDINLIQFDNLMGELGVEHFGGGFDKWESLWFCQDAVQTSAGWSFEDDEASVLAERVPAGTLMELAN